MLPEQFDMRLPFARCRQQLPQSGVESDQFAFVLDRKRKQIGIGDLSMTHQPSGAKRRDFRYLHIERKKSVMAMREIARQQLGCLARTDAAAGEHRL